MGTTALQESAQILLAGRRKTAERLEVIAGPTGRRNWPDAVKARIVLESFEPGARVVDVARRHGVAPQQVTTWRRLARQGKLALPVEEGAEQAFAALVVDEGPSTAGAAAPVEIEADGVIVRLAADAPAVRVAEIAAASCGSPAPSSKPCSTGSTGGGSTGRGGCAGRLRRSVSAAPPGRHTRRRGR